ncbi:transmembrane protein 145-like [Dermatophagoides pteronyssinus]|uniref:transmembrane protein 145-like n=1 Tax=Dermatophagoides pteronyssinus TaxID=6956 RepID=UPI003F67A832
MERNILKHFTILESTKTSLYLLIVIIIITNLQLKQIDARIIEGEIRTNEDWVFIARFCFLSKEGVFEYNVTYPKSFAPQNLLLYFDAKSQWPAVYKQNKTCEEKRNVLIDDFNQIINLTEYRREYKATTASGCRIDRFNNDLNETWYRCVQKRTFQSYRERWWYIALDNCGTKKGLYLKYRITMTNSQSNTWLKHFSADEFYILHTDVIMCILFYLLLFATCFEAYALYTRHLFHKTYKLYIASLLSECLGLLFLCIYYGIFAQQGNANIALKLFGKAFEAASTLIFLLLLLLISKGYTITRARMKSRTVAKFTMFMVMSSIAYAIIFYHEQYLFDPGEVLYMYESSFGYLLISLRLMAWSWFSYAIVFTLIHYPQKSAFFAKLFLVYSIWFISAPIVILVATFVIPKWMREKIINAVELAIAFKAHLIFFYLTRPSRANKNFPFHVRTTQISIMEKTGNIESGTLEHFNNYKYAPTRSTPIDVFAITSAAFASLGNGVVVGGTGGSNNSIIAKGINNNNRSNNNNRITNSAESEITSVASLSNQSSNMATQEIIVTSNGVSSDGVGGHDWMPKPEA